MNIQQHLEQMSKIQELLLKFIDIKEGIEEIYQNLIQHFEDFKIKESKQNLALILHLIANIFNTYCRNESFYGRIFQLIKYFKNEIQNLYTNSEIFNIFKSNKRLILFLIEEKLFTLDKPSLKKMISLKFPSNYFQYFTPEIKSFIDEEVEEKLKYKIKLLDTLPEDFEEKRRIGENDDYISSLIRKDLIDEFITYIHRQNYPINRDITKSIYETNSYLIKEEEDSLYHEKVISLINYAAFFGSIQIFRYLYLNKAKLSSSIWFYAIHGGHPEMIHILEEKKIDFDKSVSKYIKFAIKCFQSDVANYFINNKLENNNIKNEISFVLKGMKYNNFDFIDSDLITKNQNNFFFYCVKYDYYYLVETLLKTIKINVNQQKSEFKKEKLYSDTLYTFKQQSPLNAAIRNENIETVQLLLSQNDINVNIIDFDYIVKNKHREEEDFEYLKDDEEEEKSHDSNLDENIDEETRKFNKIIKVYEERKQKRAIRLEKNKKALLYIRKMEEEGKPISDTSYILYDLKEYKSLVDIRYDERTPLFTAVSSNNLEITKLLLEFKNIDVNYSCLDKEITALHKAIKNENIKIILLLLSNENIDINKLSGNIDKPVRMTALHYAIHKKNYEIVELLLECKKTDINSKTKILNWCYPNASNVDAKYMEITPLYQAVDDGLYEIIELLLSNEKIDVNAYSYLENFGYCDSGEYLKDERNYQFPHIYLEIYDKFVEKKTALHCAIEKKDIEIVELLLQCKNIDLSLVESGKNLDSYEGIDPSDDYEKTALQLAIDMKADDIVKLLKQSKGIKRIFNCSIA